MSNGLEKIAALRMFKETRLILRQIGEDFRNKFLIFPSLMIARSVLLMVGQKWERCQNV